MAERSTGPSLRTESPGAAPVQDRFLTLRGLRLHYRDWGSPAAPPLVLLHGGQGNARQWDTVARALADRSRVLAPDLRGHGESDHAPDGDYAPDVVAGDVAALADALGLGRFALVGFSIGGHAAYIYAAGHPDRVERLVLSESFIPPDTPEARAYLNAARGLTEEVIDDPEEAVAAFAAAGFAPYAPQDEVRHWVVSGLARRADGRWAYRRDPRFRRPPAPDKPRFIPPAEVMWGLLARVACPTLVVRGAASEIVPAELAERVAAAMPDARVATLPQAGHCGAAGQPDRLRAAGPGLPRERVSRAGGRRGRRRCRSQAARRPARRSRARSPLPTTSSVTGH